MKKSTQPVWSSEDYCSFNTECAKGIHVFQSEPPMPNVGDRCWCGKHVWGSREQSLAMDHLATVASPSSVN